MSFTAIYADRLTQSQTRWSILSPFIMRDSVLISTLAYSLLAGEPSVELLTNRCSQTLGRPWPWLRQLARRYVANFGHRARPRHREVVQFLRDDSGFRRAQAKYPNELFVKTWLTPPQEMQPIAAASDWDIPAINSVGDLSDWLGLNTGELRWFADLRALGYKQNRSRLEHYRYRIVNKRFGTIRLIESPKARLKDLQRQILSWILAKIPAHPAAHGFIKGRSIKTFVTPHVGQRVVLRMDLRDFFPTFAGARIQSLFRTLGYPETVADLIGGICTNSTPARAWSELEAAIDPVASAHARRLYSRPHLPQGAPTSPLLANLCSYRMDCRLAALAHSAGATYTRYADDLAFSGPREFEECVDRFAAHVGAILLEEGFAVNHRKTRVMRQGVRQHLAGLVTNRLINVPRDEFDRLKAILTNCARGDPERQNLRSLPRFRSHLEGRVAFVAMVNPGKGARLQAIFERIQWQAEPTT